MKKNLFYKIFFSYLVIISLSFLLLDLFLREEVEKNLTSQIETEMMSYAKIIDLSPREKVTEQIGEMANISNCRVTLIDARGKVFADSEKDVTQMENHSNRPEVQEARLKGSGISVRFSSSLNIDMLYVAVTIRNGEKINGYVRLARPLHDVQKVIQKMYESILGASAIAVIVSLLIALFISYRLAEPIRAMERFTEKLRQGEPVGAILLNTADETKKLADNINFLVEELKDKIRIANEEKSKLMTALTSMTEGVLIINAQGLIEFVSPVLGDMLSVRYEDVFGKTLMEAFRSAELQKILTEFKRTGENITREITLDMAEVVILNVSVSAVHGYPQEDKTMIVFHDVTRLKKLEKVKEDFVANVTHEIRTPLTAIIGYLETIKNGAIVNIDETKKFVDIILNQAERLNRLVEDLLTLSHIELKELKFNFENVSINAAITNVISLVETKAKEKKITIHNNVRENFPMIRADKDKLTQIFVNILDNAVKFTPESGRITIAAKEADAYTAVSISDTGIGVPRDEIQRLGERFYRVDRSRSRDLGGTGLGLSIVKHLMIAHGGRMEIESELGRGTTVSLLFPLAKKEQNRVPL
ncbi:MAG TPA: ATP-binding protein [Smithellaceae bacterium]|nr:ATP-binding protein [Smithellaceae bacterium]HNT91247.1 ATP-binding protein [Smithellaceae bacterium]HNV63977.1 ATP-binding protein [Smithellaceae bacterium]HOF77940.1 ATP-binding protein [Smithellaceae bacterium]HOM69077.1 ATP-binding protein [Smithellaceae bacterium]